MTCKCEHGTTCGRGPGDWDYPKCDLEYLECFSKHAVNNCDHDWSGPDVYIDGFGTGSCAKCGMYTMNHDLRHSP